MSLLDARTLDRDARLSADLCIVGAGAAGISLARDLTGSGLRVIVLTGGDLRENPEHQALYAGRMSGLDTWDMSRTRVRSLGGTTEHWAGWCRPLSPEDFEVRGWMPDSGWPFSYDDLVPYYRRAMVTTEIGGFDYDVTRASRRSDQPTADFDPAEVETRFYQYSPPTRFGRRYRDELDAASDVSVHLHGHLLNIALGAGRGEVSHLECGTLTGTRFTVEAARYVLAMGGLENPRMLLASNRQAASGVANGNDLVGRYFMEHPHYYSSAAIVTSQSFFSDFYARHEIDMDRNGEAVRVRIQGGVALPRPVRDANGIPNFTATVGDAELDDPLSEIGAGPAATLAFRGRRAPRLFRVTVRSEQTPERESRVTLQDDAVDALGLPRIDLDWRIRPQDDVAMHRAFELLGIALGKRGMGRVWMPASGGRFSWEPRPGAHHMGTTRMHDDPALGVTDRHGKCHEVDNLYCAGSSLFPTGGDANPTLTIVALAHRLADHLKETA